MPVNIKTKNSETEKHNGRQRDSIRQIKEEKPAPKNAPNNAPNNESNPDCRWVNLRRNHQRAAAD